MACPMPCRATINQRLRETMHRVHHFDSLPGDERTQAAPGITGRQTAAERLLNRMARGPLYGVPQACPHRPRTSEAAPAAVSGGEQGVRPAEAAASMPLSQAGAA